MVKLWDETDEIVREHLDYLAGEGRQPWDALCALEGPTTVCRSPVDWEFVERQYRRAYVSLPKPGRVG